MEEKHWNHDIKPSDSALDLALVIEDIYSNTKTNMQALDNILTFCKGITDRRARKHVYLVRQTQPVDYYEEKTIAVFEDRQQAEKLAQELNKEYGQGVVFDKDYNFIDFDPDYDYDSIHYYDIDAQEVNPKFEDYGIKGE